MKAAVHILVQKDLVALPINRAHAADGDIAHMGGPQKKAALPAVRGIVRVGTVPALREGQNLRGVQAADEHGTAFQMQLHIAFQQHRAAEEPPRRHYHAPAARGAGRVHGLLDSCRAVGHTVCHGTVV